MKTVILFSTLLLAATIDHFYQLGRIDESRTVIEQKEQQLTEAYQVADILARKYKGEVAKNHGLRCRVSVLAKANRMMLDRMSESDIRVVMNATLPPLEKQ